MHLEQMKDMLLTYNEYNRDLGYVQGMSDLLAPIYAVMQDDALAFWGFVKFMERMVPLIYCLASDSKFVLTIPTGKELPPRPIRHAYAATHSRSPCPTHRSSPLPPPPIRRLHQLLLLFPHASCLVQTRIRMARRPPLMGIPMDRFPQQQFPPLYRPCHPREAQRRHHGTSQAL